MLKCLKMRRPSNPCFINKELENKKAEDDSAFLMDDALELNLAQKVLRRQTSTAVCQISFLLFDRNPLNEHLP